MTTLDLNARPTVKIPRTPCVRSKDRDGAKFWAKTVTSVPADASAGTDWEGAWLTRGSTVDLPVGSLIVDADVVAGHYDVALRLVIPDGALRIIAGSTSRAWAQELRAVAREWLAMPVRDRILVAAKAFVAENSDYDDPVVVAKIEARRQWIAELEGEADHSPRCEAIARIRAIMAEHGLTVQDLA